LTLSSAIDTDSTPTVVYAQSVTTLTATANDDDVVDASNAATDGAPPTVSSAATTSSTTIALAMSESITNDSAVVGDFTIGGVASGPTVSSFTPIIGNSATTITLKLSSSILSTDTPTVTYVLNGRVIDDGATGNQLAAFANQAVTNNVLPVSGGDCYDCIPPKLQESQITISSDTYVITTGDSPLHITANVGDKVTVILNVTDNKSVQTIPYAALYTNFEERPSDMNLFYANNYDNLKQTSTSFYEWNVRADDVPYDYDGTVSWSENSPTVVTDVTTEEYFMMPFTFTMNDHMESSQIVAKIYDASGNRLHVTLPVTLETAGNEPLDFSSNGQQKVLGFFDESILYAIISESIISENITTQLSTVLGIPDESLPVWTSNLAMWVAEDKIDSADLIVAVEYLINQ
jgi:hypothetical protein